METLNYQVLEKSGYDGYILKNAPEKVLQFGEGNFLRAFVDYWFDLANEKADWNGKCVLVQPIAPGLAKMINEQEGLYTLYLRGSENGQKVDDKRVISSVSRCLNPYEKADYEKMMDVAASDDLEIIVSNTTEAGIVYDPACQQNDCPPSSFPAKLTQVLYHRYKAGKKGIIMLACELIDNNGKELLKCVNQYIDQWGLEDGFKKYVNEDCTFCGSLVDRIVPGPPPAIAVWISPVPCPAWGASAPTLGSRMLYTTSRTQGPTCPPPAAPSFTPWRMAWSARHPPGPVMATVCRSTTAPRMTAAAMPPCMRTCPAFASARGRRCIRAM